MIDFIIRYHGLSLPSLANTETLAIRQHPAISWQAISCPGKRELSDYTPEEHFPPLRAVQRKLCTADVSCLRILYTVLRRLPRHFLDADHKGFAKWLTKFTFLAPAPLAGTCYVFTFDISRNSIFTGDLVKNGRENWASKKFTMFNIVIFSVNHVNYCLLTCSGRYLVFHPLRLLIKTACRISNYPHDSVTYPD